jgi:ABC-type xylose transport system substrate-binding protein
MEAVTGRELPVVSLGELVPGSDSFVGLEGATVPTSDGSDLAAARDLVLGDAETMTYVPTRAMSEQAADVALSFLSGEPAPGGEDVDGVQSWLYQDQEVTVDTLTSVLVAQGVITLDELCMGTTEKRCTKLGLL